MARRRELAGDLALIALSLAVAGCGSGGGSTTTVGATGRQPPLHAAEATVRSHGYFPVDVSAYDAKASVAAIVAVRKGSADATAQRAFFFAGGHFAGNDTAKDSSGIRVAFARPPVIGLTYALYAARDPQCCPTDGATTVRYRWNGKHVVPLDPIPPSSFSAGKSRR
jgi:LppP/LprE lipoprotein